MMARRSDLTRALVLVPIALTLFGFAPASRPKPRPTLPTPAYSPPPSEPSPFSRPDTFCAKEDNRFEGVAPSDPRLAAPADVVWLTTPGASPPDAQAADIETFARLVDACGGIGGRPLAVHVVPTSGDPHADCANAVTELHPVIVVSTDRSPAWSCIVRDQHTILVTDADMPNADFTGSGGRLVATRSPEGIERARLLNLVASDRLADRKVAVVAGDDPAGAAFEQDARAVLAAARVKLVDLSKADTVLAPSIDVDTLPQLVADTATARRGRPLDAYAFADADSSTPAALEAEDPVAAQRLLRSANLYAFSSTSDRSYRTGQPLNAFSEMCNRAVVEAGTPRAGTTTTTRPPEPPISSSVLSTADVCLLSRIVDRALFAAGPTLDQRALITALHRLPYIDQAAGSGTPKPRPNQVVNEAVRRIEQVVVLTQLQGSCPSDTTTTTAARVEACWAPVSGWDDGGQVVNAPLPGAPVAVSH